MTTVKNTPPLGPAPTRPLPGAADGLGGRRREVLALLVGAPEPLTVNAVADALGGHPNAARAHLAALAGAGLAVLEPGSPQGRGRPATAYRATDAGRGLVARDRDPTGPREQAIWLLDRLGFTPVERGGDVVHLTTCPLLEQAKESPERVCRVHRDLVADTLRAHGGSAEGLRLVPFSDPGACRLELPQDGGEKRG